MWFKKSKDDIKEYVFPGTVQSLDAHAAVYAVETTACDAVVVHAVPEWTEMTGALKTAPSQENGSATDRAAIIRQTAHLQPLTALMTGYALTGMRTAAMTGSLTDVHEALDAMAGKRLPCVINMTCRASTRQGGALHGSHDAYYGVAGAGLFQLFAKNVQEAADFTILAHRIAEHALVPGICACDLYQTSHSVQTVRMPEQEFIRQYLGHAEDRIDTPTASQNILFGTERRRIPMLLDTDHPAGIGSVQDEESYFRALVAGRAFFSNHIEDIADRAMEEFEAQTGRSYGPVSGYRTDDADVVVIAQGAVVEALEAVADYLRVHEHIKAGVINLSMFRPFPGARLTHLLKGKKVVTVLERTDQPLAEDLPLVREVRSAIGKAWENGYAEKGNIPYPAYETYLRANDIPQVLTGIYGIGCALPSLAELVAVFRNMTASGVRKKQFYTGIDFDRSHRRFPHLQTLQQKLTRDYPDLSDLSLPGVEKVSPPDHDGHVVQFFAMSSQGGLFAGNLFAQAVADSLGWSVKTFPQGGLTPDLQPACMTIVHTETGQIPTGPFDTVDTILVSSYNLLDTIPSRCTVRQGGTVVVESNRALEDFRYGLSGRTVRWLQTHEIRLYVIDAQTIASETASNPSFIDQLAVWALLGTYLHISPQISPEDIEQVCGQLRTRLTSLFQPGHYLIEDITVAIARGAEDPVELPLETPVTALHAETESTPPWTVQQVAKWDGSMFDLTRFWHSVGYFYNSGQSNETLIDPYLATGIVPARSGAFRDMTPYRLHMPHWLAENCNGCGLCWTFCPDSALPPAVQSVASLIRTAMDACQEEGVTMIQMQRVIDPLAKLADRLIAGDELNRYMAMGPLLQDAFTQLLERMAPQESIREALTEEFLQIDGVLEMYPISKTEPFFETPNKRDKRGHLLSIALNPLSCTGCGVCIEVCPEQAFEWTDQTPDRLAACHQHREFQMTLPEISDDLVASYISETDPQTLTRRLLATSTYHTMTGGEGTLPGYGVKIALHLLTATIESVMRPRFKTHVDRLSHLIERIEDKIQGRVSDSLKINDFDQFSQQMSRLGGNLTPESLTGLLGADAGQAVDTVRLQRLTDILNRLREQHQYYTEGTTGTGRARMVMVIDPGNHSFRGGTYPYNPYSHPWVCHLPGKGAALAEGIFEGMVQRVSDELHVCRYAKQALDDQYDTAAPSTLNREDFSEEEWALIPPVLVIGRPGDIDREDLSRLLSCAAPIKIVLINTEGLVINETSSVRQAQYPDVSAFTRRNSFVLQTTIGHPGHFMLGVTESMQQPLPALFHIHAPDPDANGIAPEKVVEQAQMAYRSRAFPLFKYNPYQMDAEMTLVENPEQAQDWTSWEMTVNEPSGVTSSFTVPFTIADWAFREARFRHHFRLVSKGERNDRMKLIPEYLALTPDQRGGVDAYIHVTDAHHRHYLAIVAPDLIRVIENRQKLWRELRELAGTTAGDGGMSTRLAAQPEPEHDKMPSAVADHEQIVYQRMVDRLLQLCGYSQDPDYFNQSLRTFVTQSRTDAPEDEEDA